MSRRPRNDTRGPGGRAPAHHRSRRPRRRLDALAEEPAPVRAPRVRSCSTSTTSASTTAHTGRSATSSMSVRRHEITAFIGPSGCGKTTVLRCFNRMNDLIEGARVEGELTYHGVNLYDDKVNAVEVRRRIGMVFQKPNPFPKSIYDNVAYGPRIGGHQEEVRARRDRRAVAQAGRAVGRGQGPAQGLGARHVRWPAAAPVHRPCRRGRSRGDPHGRAVLGARSRSPPPRIEDLMREIKTEYTIVIVTHNMQQAARVSATRPRSSRPRSTPRATCAPASWSSSTAPTRSSRTRPTSGPRTTSPGDSGDVDERWPKGSTEPSR